VNNLAYHETVCRSVSSSLIEHAELNGNKPLDDYTLDKQVNLRLVFKSDKDRIKELEEENKKLRDALKILNEKLDVVNRRVNRMQDDAYNDIMPDRDDYR
jgi:molecular chaperone GrpE (heat shock protein)